MKTKTIDPLPGYHISKACQEAVAMAIEEHCNVQFDFNGIQITATPASTLEELMKFYDEESDRRREAYLASPEYATRQEEARKATEERKKKMEAALEDAPEHLTLADPEAWEKTVASNKDGYGGAVMSYAERWARMMENRISKGESISSMADECSHLADEEGITGFMYGCAVSILAKVWKHGEELRQWHNLKTQIRDEGEKANESGGVLNPACLSVG